MNNIIYNFISKIMETALSLPRSYYSFLFPDPIISRWLTIYLLHNSPAITMAGY